MERIMRIILLTLIFFLNPFILCAQSSYSSYSEPLSSGLNDYEKTYDLKNYSTALALSLGTTIVSVGSGAALSVNEQLQVPAFILVFGGILVAPSSGNMYAKNQAEVKHGIITRTAGLSLVGIGTWVAFQNSFNLNLSGYDEDDDNGNPTAGYIIALGGVALYSYGLIRDFFSLRRSVTDFNHRHQTELSIIPLYDAANNAPVLSLKLSF